MDERKIQEARFGSRSAQAELLGCFQDVWYRMAYSMLGNSDWAQEATQEAAVRFLRQLPEYRGESRIRTWSVGIVMNVCREMRRRESRGVPDDLHRPGNSSPDGAAESAEEAEGVHEALAGLPERQREVVMLRFFEELSVEETAEAMECAPGTVKATLHQALKAMKRKLGARGSVT